MKRLSMQVLTVLLILSLLCGAAMAAGEVYVNDAGGKISDDLSETYAVGAAGTQQLGNASASALTASGLQQVGGKSETYDPVPVDLKLVRVGLFYGSDARAEMPLTLTNGSGFQVGYFDANRSFVSLGTISAADINVVPDHTADIAAGTTGGYHIRLNQTYASFNEAREAADASGGFPFYQNGTFVVLVGSYTSREDADAALKTKGYSGAVYTGTDRSVLILRNGSEKVLFGFDCGSSYSLAVSPISEGKAITKCGSYSYYGDFQFTRLTGDKLTVVNFIGLEDYTKGVLANEMGADWPLEALKAQAVMARTYAVANQNKFRAYGFDLSPDTKSQVYNGLHDATDKTNQAVDETAGMFVRYQGAICTVYYFAADGGATEDSENVWSDTVVPYLRAVKDPYEADIDFYCKSWSLTVPKSQTGEVTTTKTPIGNILTLTAGGKTYSKDGVRDFLRNIGARYTSRHFTVTEQGDNYVISGGGYGHNLGMSQWGAYAMAKVHNMTFDQIISFYFTGAYVG